MSLGRSARAVLWVTVLVGSASPSMRADRLYAVVPRSGRVDGRYQSFVNDNPATVFDAPSTLARARGHIARAQGFSVRSSTTGPGCARLWLEIGDRVWVCGDLGWMSVLPPRVVDQSVASTPEGLPWSYAFTARDAVPVWWSAGDARAQGARARGLWEANWGFALRARHPSRVFESLEGYFLRREDVYRAELSGFTGASLTGLDLSLGARVGWVVEAATPSFASLAEASRAERPVGSFSRLSPLRVTREARAGRWVFAEVDNGRWVRRDRLRVLNFSEPLEAVGAGERWVDIDRREQTLVAYEGPRAVYATMVSTGGTGHETPQGSFRVWARYLSHTMDNTENNGISGHFRMGDVPWVQFFDADRGLHSVYWHNDFGHARSHGCVNLSPRDGQWLFRWAGPALPVGWQAVFSPGSEGLRVRVR